MSRIKFVISALGCKVNQYDAAVLKRALLARNFEVNEKNSDLAIISTCSVTKTAIVKDKQIIKKIRSRFPDIKLVIIGCWPETHKDIDLGVDGVLLWGVGKTEELVKEIEKLYPNWGTSKVLEESLLVPSDRSRYFLKVGDGCNQFCSYCLIPYARGPITSRPLDSLIAETKEAIAAGYGEIILSGIHLGRYGQDLKTGESLIKLLKELLALPGLGRLRLSSIEINEVDDELTELMKNNEQICRHLHISLQSGCDKILKLMKRPYNTEYFKDRIQKLRAVMPEIAISTDIIIGFPGENGEDFVDTCRFAEEIGFSKIHVFSFSAHEKTAAYSLPDRVPYDKIKQRSKILRDISDNLEKKYRETILKDLKGKKIKVIVERVRGAKNKGKTEFYFDIEIENKGKIGSLIEVQL